MHTNLTKGVASADLIDLIRANVRTPDASIGDMQAQVASLSIAEVDKCCLLLLFSAGSLY